MSQNSIPDAAYKGLYHALIEDVRDLQIDFRSMQIGASDREQAAYEDAHDMVDDALYLARQREKYLAKERKEANG